MIFFFSDKKCRSLKNWVHDVDNEMES